MMPRFPRGSLTRPPLRPQYLSQESSQFPCSVGSRLPLATAAIDPPESGDVVVGQDRVSGQVLRRADRAVRNRRQEDECSDEEEHPRDSVDQGMEPAPADPHFFSCGITFSIWFSPGFIAA